MATISRVSAVPKHKTEEQKAAAKRKRRRQKERKRQAARQYAAADNEAAPAENFAEAAIGEIPRVSSIENPLDSVLVVNSRRRWKPTLMKPGIRAVHFGPNFNIRNAQLEAISSAPLEFRKQLTTLRCGNRTNECGSLLTDSAVIKLSKTCPNLEHVTFERATQLTDAALSALLHNCPKIRHIEITGSKADDSIDNMEGKIRDSALEELGRDARLAPLLRKLILVEQELDIEEFEKEVRPTKSVDAVEMLSGKRPNLRIVEGSGDMITWQAGEVVDAEFDDAYTDWEDEDEAMDYQGNALFGPNGMYDYDEQFRGFGGFDSGDWDEFMMYSSMARGGF